MGSEAENTGFKPELRADHGIVTSGAPATYGATSYGLNVTVSEPDVLTVMTRGGRAAGGQTVALPEAGGPRGIEQAPDLATALRHRRGGARQLVGLRSRLGVVAPLPPLPGRQRLRIPALEVVDRPAAELLERGPVVRPRGADEPVGLPLRRRDVVRAGVRPGRVWLIRRRAMVPRIVGSARESMKADSYFSEYISNTYERPGLRRAGLPGRTGR